MDSLFAIRGQNFLLMAADEHAIGSILVVKPQHDKIRRLGENCLLASAGQVGDTNKFTEYIERNLKLLSLTHGRELSPSASASYIRNTLAEALRDHPYEVNSLFGGMNADGGFELYNIDYLGACVPVDEGTVGYCGHFVLGIFDEWRDPNMTVEGAKELAKKVINELRTRFIVNNPSFIVKILTPEGLEVEHY